MSNDKDRRILEDVIRRAERYAKRALMTDGTVRPALFIHGVDGHWMYSDGYFLDVDSKDMFVEKARLVCIAKRADATAVVAEAWMRRATKGEKVDLSRSFSQYGDKQDVVIIKGETRTWRFTEYMPVVVVDHNRVFLAPASEVRGETVSGRFEALLPQDFPTEEERERAKHTLAKQGMKLASISNGEAPYYAISPDGHQITPDSFKSQHAAQKYVDKWCERFRNQGYYSAVGRKIPVNELGSHVAIVSEDDIEEVVEARLPKRDRGVRYSR